MPFTHNGYKMTVRRVLYQDVTIAIYIERWEPSVPSR